MTTAGATGDHTLRVLTLVLLACGMVLTQDTCCAGHSLTDADVKTNLTKGACVRMSSQYKFDRGYTFPGSRAIDGMYEPPLGRDSRAPDYSSVAITNKEKSPWIQIDLKTTRCIKGVKVWNRNVNRGSLLGRFKNPLIRVTDDDSISDELTLPGFCAFTADTPISAVPFFQCYKVMCGRYVTVMARHSYNYLNLWEIEIHGW